MSKSLLVITGLLVILDAATKMVIRTVLLPGQSMAVFGNVVRITFVPNYSGFSWWVPHLPSWVNVMYEGLLIILVIAAYPIYLFYTQTRRNSVWTGLAFVLLLSACLGHLLGDIGQPYTTDFIQVLNSPSANLADVYAYIGLGSLMMELYLGIRLRKGLETGLRGLLASMLATRREFIEFVKSNFWRAGED
jgi:lipoprotein signal peptidase